MTNDEPVAYLNGEYVPASECKLPVFDLGIVLGASVTDFLRTFNGRPYRMAEHVERLYRSARYACITPPISAAQTMAVTEELITRNLRYETGAELGLVYYMTAGINEVYAGSAGSGRPSEATFVQHTFRLPFGIWSHYFTDGAHCITPSNRHWPPQCLSSKIKNRNRLHMWIGEQQVHLADPAAVPLYLDLNGHITETGGSNFVIYRDGGVVSPRRNNILWGISLSVLVEILAELGIPFREDDIDTYDAVNAEEAWLPTTPYCLAPVVKLNGQVIGEGKPGPLWRRIIDTWSKHVGKDIYAELAGSGR